MRGGEEVKISKRAGSYVTLRDLIDEAGRDAVRFFLDLAQGRPSSSSTSTSRARRRDENPVYYVQYAHARVCSVLRQAGMTRDDAAARCATPTCRRSTSAVRGGAAAAARRLSRRARAPRRASWRRTSVTFYLQDLAAEFHSYYNAERFLVDDARLRAARLALVVGDGPGAAQRAGRARHLAPDQM